LAKRAVYKKEHLDRLRREIALTKEQKKSSLF